MSAPDRAWGESITLNEVIGYFGLPASAILVLRVVAGVIRDGQI